MPLLLFLAVWYPGDPTLRALSEGYLLNVMISRGGLSIGKYRLLNFRSAVRRNPVPHPNGMTNGLRRSQLAQVEHPPPEPLPQWHAPLELEASRGDDGHCFFRVTGNSLALYDHGFLFDFDMTKSLSNEPTFQCIHFSAAAEAIEVGLRPHALPTLSDSSAGRVVLLRSTTSLSFLSEFRRSLLNHQAYAEAQGYHLVLSVVRSDLLEGRSGKFAKHLSLGAHAADERWDTACHIDLDAFFSSWEPLSEYTAAWPAEKELMLGDTGQVWLNTGIVCIRPSAWTASFFERVVNAAHHSSDNDSSSSPPTHYGFKRDQPAFWHVLFEVWSEEGGVSYAGKACAGWRFCNPDENPLECWHTCFYDVLQQYDAWSGLQSLNDLPHIHLTPGEEGSPQQPPFHRMCLRSCKSAAALATIGACGLAGLPGCGFAKEELLPSGCDGVGCLEQLTSGGGAWLKHTGHKHWDFAGNQGTSALCIPTNEEEAKSEQVSPASVCI